MPARWRVILPAVVLVAFALAPSALGATGLTAADAPRLTEDEATRIALESPKVAAWLHRYPPEPHTSADFRESNRTWAVSVWSGEAGQIAKVKVEDSTGRVTEAWTGPQVAWKMARAREGAFGGKTLNHTLVWLAFCAVFLAGLGNLRRPLSLRNLDLVALLSFTLSLELFNRGEIFASVPLAYPPLFYLLGRGLWIGVRGRGETEPRSAWPVWALLGAVVFLSGFRIGLNVETEHGVIDVGYAGVIGAQRIAHGEAPYGHMPIRGALERCGKEDEDGDVRDRVQTNGRCESANEHGDTYGPVSYLAYVPGYLVFGWSGKWDELWAAHATSVAFDLLTMLGLVLVGRRFGGTRLAATLAFAWAAYPFTAYTLNADTNDAMMPTALVWGFWLLSSAAARGAAVAAAGWTKFGALLLAPLWASYPAGFSARSLLRFAAAFGAVTIAGLSVLLLEPSLGDAVRTFWNRTIGFQLDRESPFSLWSWGQYRAAGIPDLHVVQLVVEGLALALAVVVSVVPRKKGPLALAALTASVLVAFQVSLTHWFYLYLVWAFPFLALALFLPRDDRQGP